MNVNTSSIRATLRDIASDYQSATSSLSADEAVPYLMSAIGNIHTALHEIVDCIDEITNECADYEAMETAENNIESLESRVTELELELDDKRE